MNMIKEITENGYTLVHSWHIDYMGLQRNYFEINYPRSDGIIVRIPFLGNIRVSRADRDTVYLGDDISPYKDEEYINMLRERILLLPKDK